MSVGNNVAGIAHFMAERNRISGNESDNRLFMLQIFIEIGADFFKSAAHLPDHDNNIGFLVLVKEVKQFFKTGSDQHVVTETDDGGLSHSGTLGFKHGFISQG